MVLQYKLKYPTKNYDFRLLNENKSKVLIKKGNYEKVMRRFRQIDFFKHKK